MYIVDNSVKQQIYLLSITKLGSFNCPSIKNVQLSIY